MNNNWKQDPRLNSMDPNKIALLSEFAKKSGDGPKKSADSNPSCPEPGSQGKECLLF